MTRTITLLAVVPALAWALSACASSPAGTAAPPATSSSSMPVPSAPSTPTPPGGAASSAAVGAGEAVISISDFAFTVPASVAPGAQVVVRNGDSQAHTLTSKAGGFDVTVDPGGTATLTAPSTPGRYRFVCSFHGNMTSTLVVA